MIGFRADKNTMFLNSRSTKHRVSMVCTILQIRGCKKFLPFAFQYPSGCIWPVLVQQVCDYEWVPVTSGASVLEKTGICPWRASFDNTCQNKSRFSIGVKTQSNLAASLVQLAVLIVVPAGLDQW